MYVIIYADQRGPLDEDKELADEIERVDRYKETFEALIRAEQLDMPVTPPTTTTSVKILPATVERNKSVRLPKLQLRHFNSDLTKWTIVSDNHLKWQ